MTHIQPEPQVSFMPHRTYRLLSQMYFVVLDCLAYYVYFNAIQKTKRKNKDNNWLIVTHNAYYDLCVQRWCMLFGSEPSEPTHFYHLMSKKYNLARKIGDLQITPPTKITLKDHILFKGKINHSNFHKFRTNTLLYRNKHLIHREHDPNVIHDKWINMPLTKNILQTAYPLYEVIIQLAATFPGSPDSINKHPFVCRLFNSKNELSRYYQQTFLQGE